MVRCKCKDLVSPSWPGSGVLQIKVEDRSNEITAMPKLLSLFGLEECIVTADVLGCQKESAKAILTQRTMYWR